MLALIATATLLAPPTAVHVSFCSAEIVYATTLNDPPGLLPRPFLLVRAEGSVSSSGWGDAQLVVVPGTETARGIGPSKDGYLEFSFVATPPAKRGVRLTVIEPVSATTWGNISVVPGMLKGVRVYGTQGNAAVAAIMGLRAAEGRAIEPRMIEDFRQDSRRKAQPRSR